MKIQNKEETMQKTRSKNIKRLNFDSHSKLGELHGNSTNVEIGSENRRKQQKIPNFKIF